MKYGILVVTPITDATDRSLVNIGDQIQAEAILYLYEQMGIKRENVLRLDIKDITHYKGEYVILPININLSLNWIVNIFPMSPYIIPVFLGLSYFSAEALPQYLADYFRNYGPIGCRDESTLDLMRRNSIPAYLYGCITMILPDRSIHSSEKKKIYLVDVPASFDHYCSKNDIVLNNVERTSHIIKDPEMYDYNWLDAMANDLLDRYCKEAALVVTSRLHCMSPCMAMGVPVIPVTDNISPRMGWIDRYLKIYTPETYGEIDWSGQRVSCEDDKHTMINIAARRIQETVCKYEQILDWSYFLESREKEEYGNYYREVLKKLPAQKRVHFEYVLWGAGQIGINAYQVISAVYPNSRLVAVIDSYCEGTFFGVPIQKPDALKKLGDSYIFITTTSGEQYARSFLSSIEKIEVKDFLSMATTAG